MTTERQRLERERSRIEERLLKLDAMPLEPEVEHDCAVIMFERKISSRTYTYAAVKAGGAWWITGKDHPTQGYSWEMLMDLLGMWRVDGDIWLAVMWEVL